MGSAEAWSLLVLAMRQDLGMELPPVETTPGGKPCFRGGSDVYFSLSHTRGAALAAVSRKPIGADVEQRRDVRESTVRRILEVPHGDLDLFELWTLRESWFKLTGRGDLRSIPISREHGIITLPEKSEGIQCRLYDDIPGCAAAVCCDGEAPPDHIRYINPEQLLRTDSE